MKEKQAVTREYRPRYRDATKKEKRALTGGFTRLAGYRRKSAARLLNVSPVREVLVNGSGRLVKLTLEKSGPLTARGSGFTPMRS